MGKYFGTDGFRGEANVNLTADHAYKVGRFLGWYYGERKRQAGDNAPARVVIGKDTRRSSYMFEYCAGGWLGGLRRGCLPDACYHHAFRGIHCPSGRLRLRHHDFSQPQSLLR